LQADLAAFIRRRYGVEIPPGAWPAGGIPAHLRPRIEVLGNDQKAIGTGRDLAALRQKLEQVKARPAPDNSAWTQAARQWERREVTAWDFGDLPPRITISENGPVPVYAWPGLALDQGVANLRLFRTEDSARQASLGGIQYLVELALSKDFAWLHRDLRLLSRFEALAANLCSLDDLQATALENLKRHVLPAEVFWPLTASEFAKAVQQTRLLIPGLAIALVDQAGVILRTRREIEPKCGPAPALPVAKPQKLSAFSQLNLATKDAPKPVNVWAEELAGLVPPNFLAVTPYAQLAHLPRYLKALATRMERARLNPVKDKERAALVAPYLARLKALRDQPASQTAARRPAEEFRWMVEEFKVSVFAQELGTAFPISPKRLEEFLSRNAS